jgi:hypothetical protein
MDRPGRTSLLSTLLSRIGARRVEPEALKEPVRPFQAISIYRGTAACEAARRISEYRFLAKDAPTLPLPACTMPETCACRYLKHKDRRSNQRRHVDFTATSRIYIGKERRQLRGRRSTDVHGS